MDRFVRIADVPWTEGTYLTRTFSPFSAYLTHPTVVKKLEGFSRFHMKGLELKFLLNGAPTQYGSVLVSYRPLPGFAGGEIDQTAGSLPYFIARTCYPHTYLSVATSAGATMKIPFVCPKNCISTTGLIATESAALGTIALDSIGALNTAGTPSVNPIVVTVYARPIDLFMWGPTTYTVQSDEYGVTPVSTMASVVASAAGILSSVPTIRPYMLATQMAAGAMSSIARLFGYSNPPVIEPVHVFMNRPTYGLSSPEIPIQMDKLALDPKNELTVDPRTVGAPVEDGMLMSTMMDRDVYIAAGHWYGTDIIDTGLFGMHVTPEYAHVADAPSSALTIAYGANKVQMTPACHLAQMFKYWRGPIHFTFTAIASQFHRGRYVIEYEPAGRTTADGQGLIRQWVVDIKESPTFKVTIDMCTDVSWLPTQRAVFTKSPADNEYVQPRALEPANVMEANGTLRVRVLNDLTSSAAVADIVIFVRVNCKDVEFACPLDVPGWPTTHITQCDVGDLAATTMEATVADESVETRTTPHDSVIYHGEVVKSVRTLLQRATFFRSLDLYPYQPPASTANDHIARGYSWHPGTTKWNKLKVKWLFSRIGSQVGSLLTVPGLAAWSLAVGGTTLFPYVYGKPTNIAYLSPCYVGYRGGVSYRIFVDSNAPSGQLITAQSVSIERSQFQRPAFSAQQGAFGTAFGHTSVESNDVAGQQYLANTNSGASGIGLTNDVRYLDAVVPHYSRYRMLPGLPAAQQSLFTGLDPVPFVDETDNVEVTATFEAPALTTIPTLEQWMGAPKLHLYQQAGVDFTLLFYLAPPTMYSLRSAPNRG